MKECCCAQGQRVQTGRTWNITKEEGGGRDEKNRAEKQTKFKGVVHRMDEKSCGGFCWFYPLYVVQSLISFFSLPRVRFDGAVSPPYLCRLRELIARYAARSEYNEVKVFDE